MPSPRTPEEEPGGDRTQIESPDQLSPEEPASAAPPPPQWLDEEPMPPGAHLLPEPPPFPSGPGNTGPAEDQTVSDFDEGSTQFIDRSGTPAAPSPDVTVTDLSDFLPSAGASGEPQEESPASSADSDKTSVFPHKPPAPAPSTEQIPGAGTVAESAAKPQEPPPFAPIPFPYAQDIPDTPLPAPPAPTAPEPSPWVHDVPADPAPPPPAPFPWAQEIPGQQQAQQPAVPPPFPWAQEIPGQPHQQAQPQPNAQPQPYMQQAQASPQPVAPPPQIDEPWRTPPQGKPKRGTSKILKRLLLVGGAGLAAAALVAAGVVVVLNLTGGESAEAGGGARLAGSIFPVDAAVRTDGHDQQITSVAATGSTVVAVGGEAGSQGSRGLFLVSTDGGRTFKAAKAHGDDGASRPGEVPVVVGGSAEGWVAIGSRPGGGAVWTSENGQDWRKEPNAVGDVFGPNNRVRRVVSTGSGYLAIGENSPKGDFTDSVPAVWLSSDGRRWEARNGEQVGLQVRDAKPTLVEAAAGGNVILLEALITPDKEKQAPFRRVWRSADGGRTWADSNVPVPKGSRGLTIGGGPAGFIAMREIKDGGKGFGQVFTSKDGTSWTQAGRLEPTGYQATHRLMGDDKGFAAVVVRERDIVVSRSADGAAWRDAGALASQPGREVTAAALAGEQVIVVGREPGGGDVDPLLNVWDAGGGAVPVDLGKVPGALRSDHTVTAIGATGDRAVSVGSAAGDAAVWTSQDGGTWKAAQGLGAAFTRPGPQHLVGVTNGGAGWLAVGRDQYAPRPLVVTSADGATWQSVDAAAPFRGGAKGQPVTNATAAGPAGYVIVGTDGGSAATWFSADLKNWERGRSAGRDGALESQKGDGRWMLGATGGSFGYAAVGGVRAAKTGNRPAVWSSADGKQWTLQQLQLPGGFTEGHLTHVASRGDTMVAAGVAASAQGLSRLDYVSADAGKTWRPLPAPGGNAKATVTSLVATPKGFAATGTTGEPGAADVVAWASADGSSWTTGTAGGKGLAGDGDQQITGLAAFKDTLLGVGRTVDQNGGQPVLWSRPVP